MAFIIVFILLEVLVWEQVAAPRSLVVLLVVEPVTMISSFGIMVFIGLVGLGSQGHSHEPHPVVDGTVCPSYQAIFGWWVTVLVISAWWSCLVYDMAQGWRLL